MTPHQGKLKVCDTPPHTTHHHHLAKFFWGVLLLNRHFDLGRSLKQCGKFNRIILGGRGENNAENCNNIDLHVHAPMIIVPSCGHGGIFSGCPQYLDIFLTFDV
jgi:hypothetical protein